MKLIRAAFYIIAFALMGIFTYILATVSGDPEPASIDSGLADVLAHGERKEFEDALLTCHLVEKMCNTAEEKVKLARTQSELGRMLMYAGWLEDAAKTHKKALPVLVEAGDEEQRLQSLYDLGQIYFYEKNYIVAQDIITELIELCIEQERKDYLAGLQNDLATIFYERFQFDEAFSLFKENEALCIETGHHEAWATSISMRGLMHKDRGNVDLAMECFKEVEGICRTYNVANWLCSSLSHQATILCDELDRPHDALPLAEEALEIATENEIADSIKVSKLIIRSIKVVIEHKAGSMGATE